MALYKVFWLEPTERERVWLRRFVPSDRKPGCPLPHGYHDAVDFLKDRSARDELDSDSDYDRPSDESPLWPELCACGYKFQPDDKRQVFNQHLYSGAPDGKFYTLRDAPIGAMWDAEWYRSRGGGGMFTGPDGLCLVVKTPGGDWMVDAEATNCTMTQYEQVDKNTRRWKGRTHYCWPRKGDPRTGMVDVRKEHGRTCGAGAGSIQLGKYHGFLSNGFLQEHR